MRRLLSLSAVVALASFLVACQKSIEQRAAEVQPRPLPAIPGFQDQLVLRGLVQPTAVRFAPDGRIFVAEKSGLVKLFESSTDAQPIVFADLRTNVHNYWDRGLLDLELHPDFPDTPYVYVLYTYDAELGGDAPRWGTSGATTDRCPTPPGPNDEGCIVSGRLSRLEAGDGGMRGLEHVLIENWPQQFPSHSIGALAFGPDGMLYVSSGDGASFNFVDYGQTGDPPNPLGDPPVPVGQPQTLPAARGGALRALNVDGSPAKYSGKIIRIDPETGLAAPGNPLAGRPGGADAIIASGFRNPYRMAFRPGTRELWIADVGWGVWEEVNRLLDPTAPAVSNYGWPCYEGDAPLPAYQSLGTDACNALYESGTHLPPHYAYRHDLPVVADDGCGADQGAVTGVAFYRDGLYPEEYRGALFFADYARGCIWSMMAGPDGVPNPADRRVFVQDVSQPVQLIIGPGNDLYYTSHAGELHRIVALGENLAPVASLRATPSSGAVPLTVSFDASASTDPDPGDSLTFSWDLDGDGAFDDDTGARVSYVYSSAGERTAAVRVTDSRGAVSSASELITAGESGGGLQAVITTLAPQQFRVGDVVRFAGEASDGDTPLSAANMHWDLVMQHCPSVDQCHPHVVESFEGVSEGTFIAPEHEFPYHVELILRASGADGRQATAVARVDPITVDLTIDSEPRGLAVTINQIAQPTPFTATVVVGSQNTISAPDHAGYLFTGWSDGGAQAHLLVAQTSTTLRASYRISPTPVPLEPFGTIIARTLAPAGGGSPTPEVIRDEDYPPPGTNDPLRQFDTFTLDFNPKDEWIGYEFDATYAFSHVVFQEGRNFVDGGWFESLQVQVRRDGAWLPVADATFDPAYPGTSDGVGFRTYRIDFRTTVGDAIRIYGPAGGSLRFVSIAELDVSGWRAVGSGGGGPFARVAPPPLVIAGETVALDGRESFDPQGSPLTYVWSQVSGPAVALSDPAAARPTFVAPDVPRATTLGFSLVVSAGERTSAAVGVELPITPLVGAVDVSARGEVLISETRLQGLGSYDPEIIRDGVEPLPGSTDYAAQYATFTGDPGVVEGWVGYDLGSLHRVGRVRFREGGEFVDGGWFETLDVQVRQNGRWYAAPNLVVQPAYAGAADGVGFDVYELDFTPTLADAVRVFGRPGGSARFFSVSELRAYVMAAPADNAPPIAEAGLDFTAVRGTTTSLDGSASLDPDANPLTYTWNQTQGPAVRLSSSGSATPTFTAPNVSRATELRFELTVRDGLEASAADGVTVMVEPTTELVDLSGGGAILASERQTFGLGNKDLEVIRDGVTPPLDATDPLLQYDTFLGEIRSEGFVGYEFPTARTFSELVFQEGQRFTDGGWFSTVAVQVRRAGVWRDVSDLQVAPAYPFGDDGQSWNTYTFSFEPAVGDAIRLAGVPGGYWTFFTVAELRVFGR